MRYDFNFGKLGSAPPAPTNPGLFRIAFLGDFSGRANSGELSTGADLASRKPMRIDVDNIDDILERMNIEMLLPIGAEGGAVEVAISDMDGWHPDELYDNLEIFSELAALRKRLKNSSTFASAAEEVRSWGGDGAAQRSTAAKPRGAAMPSGKLSDFAALVGRPTSEEREETAADDLIKQIMAPFVEPAADPQQDQLLAIVDQDLSDAMRKVLHHPDFQSLESIWRTVDWLVRGLETGTNLQIVLFDVTAEEVAADISSAEDLQESGLYKLLVEQPALDQQQGAFSAFLGYYTFELTPPHAELLGRLAKIAGAAQAPFLAGISNECIKQKKPEEIHPLIEESWQALRSLPEACYLGLAAPRFMLRWPYGKKTEPIDPFEFEEFTPQSGVKGMLWGNPAALATILLGLTFSQQGLKGMKLGSIMTVDDMPFYYYTDEHGDQVALPCTDRLLNERMAAHVTSQNFIPVLSIKGQPQVRLGRFLSLAGSDLAGPWAPVDVSSSAAAAPPAATAAAPAAAPPTQAPAAEPPAAAAPNAASEAAASEADEDLDALLASLESGGGGEAASETPAAAAEAPAEAATEPAAAADDSAKQEEEEDDADAELDALLASLEADSQPAEDDDDGMDDELAALLADL